jgi:hypothetical protein
MLVGRRYNDIGLKPAPLFVLAISIFVNPKSRVALAARGIWLRKLIIRIRARAIRVQATKFRKDTLLLVENLRRGISEALPELQLGAAGGNETLIEANVFAGGVSPGEIGRHGVLLEERPLLFAAKDS